MGRARKDAHGCCYPGCENPVTHDLILFERVRESKAIKKGGAYIRYNTLAKRTKHHLYLCDEHAKDIYDFMEALYGKDGNTIDYS